MKWGLRDRAGIDGLAKQFAFFAGLVYIGIGIIGFFYTGFDNFTEYAGDDMFGLFGITPYHNIVHIGTGAIWWLGAFALSRVATEGLNFAIGAFYIVAALLGGLILSAFGFQGSLEFLGVMSPLAGDNWLHLVSGIVALLFSGVFIPLGSDESSEGRQRVSV